MNALHQLISLTRRGIDLAESAQGMSRHRLIDLGVLPVDAQRIARVAGVYFPSGATKARAVEAARANGHSLATLDMIETFTRRLDDQRKAWSLRTRACLVNGTHVEVREACQDILRELNGPEPAVSRPRPSLRRINSKTKGPGLVYHGSSAEVNTLYRAAYEVALRRRKGAAQPTATAHPPSTADPAGAAQPTATAPAGVAQPTATAPVGAAELVDQYDLGEAFGEVFAEGTPVTVFRATIGITLDQHTRILNGDGADVELLASDGTRMTGAEFARLALVNRAGADRAMLVHPVDGPVNLYGTRRFANGKQREILETLYGMCVHPECTRPSIYCQPHHVQAVAHGGLTNIDNLVPLCPWHNAANDDDPAGPVRHGRIELSGIDVYRKLPGGKQQRSTAPTMANHLLAEFRSRQAA